MRDRNDEWWLVDDCRSILPFTYWGLFHNVSYSTTGMNQPFLWGFQQLLDTSQRGSTSSTLELRQSITVCIQCVSHNHESWTYTVAWYFMVFPYNNGGDIWNITIYNLQTMGAEATKNKLTLISMGIDEDVHLSVLWYTWSHVCLLGWTRSISTHGSTFKKKHNHCDTQYWHHLRLTYIGPMNGSSISASQLSIMFQRSDDCLTPKETLQKTHPQGSSKLGLLVIPKQ